MFSITTFKLRNVYFLSHFFLFLAFILMVSLIHLIRRALTWERSCSWIFMNVQNGSVAGELAFAYSYHFILIYQNYKSKSYLKY